MNWIDFLLGIFYSFLLRRYWRGWRPSSTVDFQRSAMLSGMVELFAGGVVLLRGCIPFLIAREHQLSPLAEANQGTQLYFSGILIFEYLFQPFSLLLLYLMAEGAVRWVAAWTVDEVLPSGPLKIVSLVQERLERKKQEERLGPIIPDVLEKLEGTEYAIRILSCRPKEGWRESITVVVDEEFYELGKQGDGTATHRFEYLLRKHPPGKVMRGMYRYEPTAVPDKRSPKA
jgi:hypothetical protein